MEFGRHEMEESTPDRSVQHGIGINQHLVPSLWREPAYHQALVHLDPIYFKAYSHHGSLEAFGKFSTILSMPIPSRGNRITSNPLAMLVHPTKK
jgi:hypothetical protein